MAANYLIDRGYTILARNYRDKQSRNEIDLIARNKDCLVFIEVKAGNRHRFGPPETWVDPRKQRRIMRAAAAYLHHHDLQNTACRFDVIGIRLDAQDPQVVHIENAFW